MEISDEDKLIINGEMFFSIRKYMRENKTSGEIIAKIEEVLQNGADINACDNNDNNNTILHIAAQKEKKDLVAYLLQKGAHLYRNNDDKTAADLALQSNTSIGKDIADILLKQGEPAACATSKRPTKQQAVLKNDNQNNISIIRADSVQEIIYSKRGGTSGVSGQFYETKLLCLVLHRALHDKAIEEFYLAANINDIGGFDDLCFRFNNVACFMQTKHKENIDKSKLTVATVRSATSKLGLGIYFDSFLKIRQKFSPQLNDPMFMGKFEDMDSYFVIYTPLKESFEMKRKDNKPMCSKLHDIIFTCDNETNNNSKITDMFQFAHEDSDLDLLTKFIKHEHMQVLAKNFMTFIMSKNKIEVMMADDLVKIYHPALAREVVFISKVLETTKSPNPKSQSSITTLNKPSYVHIGSFRPDFFYSKDNNMCILKDTFYKEIIYTHSSKTELPKEVILQKIQEIAKNPCAHTISELIGSPIKFDEASDKLSLDRDKLPNKKFKKDEIQKIEYDLQKIQVTKVMVRDAVYLAGQKKLQNLQFQLPLSFGNMDLTVSKKKRLDYLSGKLYLLINHFSKRNKNKETKIIDISSDVVGPGKILDFSYQDSNGGLGGAVGNLLAFDIESELFTFNTNGTLGENAKYVLEKLKEMTGEDLTNYKINVLVDGFPRVSFNIYQYDKNIAVEFLNKLWFYTNQAQEESVERTIKKEINLYHNADKQRQQFLFHVHSDAIFLRFHDEIQKWWKKQIEAHYLTKNTILFEKAKKGIVDSPLLTVLNVMFIRKIKHIDVKFNKAAMDCLSLNEFLLKDKNTTLNIVSDAVILSAAKIMNSINCRHNFSFINLDYVHILPSNDCETMIHEIEVMNAMTLIIISEKTLSQDLQATLLKILNSYVKNLDTLKKQLIIITVEPLKIDQSSIFQHFEYVTLKDNSVNLTDLTSKCQTEFLDKYTLTYQGQKVKLNTIIDENSKELIDGKLLCSLLNKEKLVIGNTLETHEYDEIKKYFINRNLKRDGEEYTVGTLDDIDDRIVLISSKPCMGKTILLTHLSLETKQVDPKPWIVRINLPVHEKDFEQLKNKNISKIMTFLGLCALKEPDEVRKVNFIEIDNETVAINSKDSEDISFELQYFIHCYNTGNIIFLFDGFDKIYPQNTNEGIELLTALEEANKRMWITSDCYVVEVLECKFGTSYKLERLSTIQQKSFLQRFWATNIQLEKLNHEQFNNITIFLNYILRVFNRELDIENGANNRPLVPLLSVPLHIIYLSALDYFKHEANSISIHYIREKIKSKWGLNRFSAIDRYLGRCDVKESLELAGTPLHMYIAANYFAFQITDKFDLHIDKQMIYDRSNVYINTVTLYERFLKTNIKNICEIENKGTIGKKQDKLRDDFFSRHKKLAIYAICKESDISKFLTQPEIREVKDTIKMIESGEMKTEMVDSVVNGIPRFYHWIFAEYFAVEGLSELLKRMRNDDLHSIQLNSLWDFLVNVVLVVSPKGLRNAFEYKLKYDPELAEVPDNDNCQKIIFNLLLKPNESTAEQTFNTDNALNIAVNEGLVYTTNFLLRGVRHKIDEHNLSNFMKVLKSSATILEVVDTSRSIVNEDILKCIQNLDGETIVMLLNSRGVQQNIQDHVKSKLVPAVQKITEKVIKFSGNNENLVKLVEQIPFHLPDFVRQIKKE